MHDAADDEAAGRAARNVKGRALLHAQVMDEAALCEEVGGELNGAAKAGAYHGWADAAVQAGDALGGVDLPHAVQGVAVAVLGTDGERGRKGLQARLDEKEGRAGDGTEDARGGAGEDIDAKGLDSGVVVEERGGGLAQRLVEAEAAAVERHLVDVGTTQAA